jgi:membrane-associated phospholipid phosphatase
MVIDSTMLILGLIILSGLVGFARLKLNTHSPAQVYAGFGVGVTLLWQGIVAFF